MDLLLVEVKGTNEYINNGLAYLAGSLSGRFSLEIIDMNYCNLSYDGLLKYITEEKPRVVGFSVKSSNVSQINKIAESIKKNVDCLVIVGGPHVSIVGKNYLESNKNIDYGLSFEAELSIIDFFDYLNGRKEINRVPGLLYRKGDKCYKNDYFFKNNIDELEFPNYDFFKFIDTKKYFEKHPYPLLTSRGCPYGCIYCSVNVVSGRAWRARSVENIIKEIVHAKNKYNITSFEMVDDNFTMNIERAMDFCRELIKNKINMDWGCPNGIRADRITDELAEAMHDSGCKHVSLGVESGVEEVFDKINKGEKLLDVVKALKILTDNGIRVTGFFILGLPGDNFKHTKETVKFIKKHKLKGIKWNFLIPYPNTQLWDWVGENGKFINNFLDGKHFSRTGEKVVPVFETNDFSAKDRLKAWRYANLATGLYSNIIKRPQNGLLYRIKIATYLLIFAPDIFFTKTLNRVKSIYK